MDHRREELTGKIIGLGSKSIRKNYYPELKKQINELEKSLQWQKILQEILMDLNSCIKVEEVYRRFINRFYEFSWVSPDDCVYISYIPDWKLFTGNDKTEIDNRQMSVMSGPNKDIPDSPGFCAIPLENNNRQIAVFNYIPVPDRIISDDENKLILNLVNSILPTLQRIVIQRKNEILEKQLHINQKNQSLGTLAGGIAHDFNNILTSIFGFSELAIDIIDSSGKPYEYLQGVLNSAKRAKDLIDQILSFSRAENVDRKPVYLNSSITETVKMIQSVISSRIRIEINLPDKSPVIDADQTQLQQIFLNLCTNASHAMSEKGGLLELNLEEVYLPSGEVLSLSEGSYACLKISDSGCGMDSETMSHIFEPYFTTKEKGKGTGFGLSVVYGIVSSMNGDIIVYSEPGKGTEFTIYFPVSEKKAEKSVEIEHKSPAAGNEKIFLIDDDSMVLESINLMLKSLGYNVNAFNSSLDAFDAVKKDWKDIDLIITDMTMPDYTGLDLAEKVHEVSKDLKIILISGLGELISDAEADKSGISKCIRKPVYLKDLAAAVRSVLDE